MLVVFTGVPIAAPGETMLDEKLVAEVVFIDFVREVLTAVCVGFAALRRDVGLAGAVLVVDHVWVIKRIDVDGRAVGVLG